MAVNTQLRLILDRVAKGRQNSQSAFEGGTSFWTLVDAAADETFENRVKGSQITAVDSDLSTGVKFTSSVLSPLFSLIEDYLLTDLGLTTSPYLDTYLAANGGWRVASDAADAYYDARGITLPSTRVFPKGTLPASESTPAGSGMHQFGTLTAPTTYASVDGALPSTTIGAGVLAIPMSAAPSAAATIRCTMQDGTSYKDIALPSFSGAAQYEQLGCLGQQAVAAEAASGQTAVQVAATTNFAAGEWVLIYETDALQEVAKIDSLATGPTRIVMVDDLVNTYSTAAVVIPLFTNAAYQSGGTGTGQVTLWALPDRTIAL